MKKLLVVCLCIGMSLNLSGCAIGDLIDKYTNIHETDESENSAPKTRVYMDELKGTLVDFSGNTLTLESSEETYMFDVSEATLECKSGMITGDEISIIYEGKLSSDTTDTSSVKALKVVNDYHNQHPLKENTVSGIVQNATSNTITIQDDSGANVTFPIIGCEEYFSGGIQKDVPVFIHYYGKLETPDSASKTLNASHLKVISVSDNDPLSPPDPEDASPKGSGKNQIKATIDTLNLNSLTVLLSDHTTSLSLDLTNVPCYFQGGAASGSEILITYDGSFNGATTEGIFIQNIRSEVPKKNKRLESAVAGIIIANTANTVTIQTSDGATVTCNTENVPNSSTEGMEIGSWIRVIFDPTENRVSNIYTCLKIEDI